MTFRLTKRLSQQNLSNISRQTGRCKTVGNKREREMNIWPYAPRGVDTKSTDCRSVTFSESEELKD